MAWTQPQQQACSRSRTNRQQHLHPLAPTLRTSQSPLQALQEAGSHLTTTPNSHHTHALQVPSRRSLRGGVLPILQSRCASSRGSLIVTPMAILCTRNPNPPSAAVSVKVAAAAAGVIVRMMKKWKTRARMGLHRHRPVSRTPRVTRRTKKTRRRRILMRRMKSSKTGCCCCRRVPT